MAKGRATTKQPALAAKEEANTFKCKIDADSARKFGHKKACDRCGVLAKSWTALVNHYNKEHDVPFSDMSDHFIYKQATHEQVDRKGVEMSELEFSLLAPDGSDESRFICKTCDRSLHKSSAASHFIKQHGTQSDEVKEWVVAKDASALRHKKPQKMLLTSAYDARMALDLLGESDGDQSGSEDATPEGNKAGTPSGGAGALLFTQPKAKAHARKAEEQPAETANSDAGTQAKAQQQEEERAEQQPSTAGGNDLAKVSDQISRLSQAVAEINVGVAVTVPTVQLAGEAKAWKMDAASKKKDRVQWPLKKEKDVAIDFTEFEAWLAIRVEKKAFKSYMQGLRYFYTMVDVTFTDGSDFDHVGALQAVHQQGVFQNLLELPIFNPERSWTRKVAIGVRSCFGVCISSK